MASAWQMIFAGGLVIVGFVRGRIRHAGTYDRADARRPRVGSGVAAILAAAVPAITANIAIELAPVRADAIAAGTSCGPSRPIRRVVGPADVAALAVQLMTNAALTGASNDVDGGDRLVP